MTVFVVTFRVVTDHDRERLLGGLVAALEDAEYEPHRLQVTALKPRGRQSPSHPKVQEWLRGRKKPFDVALFAKYTELSYSAAHRRLRGLVDKGLVTKQMVDGGRVEYQVYRPTTD